ncbi:proteasome regulatory particle base subunit [Ancistrocladus abbreviatus]
MHSILTSKTGSSSSPSPLYFPAFLSLALSPPFFSLYLRSLPALRRLKGHFSAWQHSFTSFVQKFSIGMMRALGFLVLLLVASVSEASIVYPISDAHRSAALELFTPPDGSFKSLEEAYEALRTFEVLGIGKKDMSTLTCSLVIDNLKSPYTSAKDVFYGLKCFQILKCKSNGENLQDVASRLQGTINGASSLLDFYYSVGSLVLIKDQSTGIDVKLGDADGIFRSVKSLSQSDGRWRYNSNNPESSIRAAGIAFETLAGLVSLASSVIDQSLIGTLQNDIMKLFDSIEKHDDGVLYFDEKLVDAQEYQGPLSTTASVVRGLMAFADVTSGNINVPGDKILGLAKFFLGVGIPGDAHDFYDQIDSLAFLENNKISIPLIISFPATVISLTRNEQLKVTVSTVLGSTAPPLTVKILQATGSDLKDAPIIENQELKFEADSGFHVLDGLSKMADVGSYNFVFKIDLHDPHHRNIYATGGQTHVPIHFSGAIKVDGAEIAILDSVLGNVETKKVLDLAAENSVSLSATHLQKMHLSFQLTSNSGKVFKPHQALLKLRHETKVEHVFVVGNSGKKFEIILDFLGLVDKLFYLSGRYDLQLTVGDAVMENSFFRSLGYIDLDLPVAPEKATRAPPQPLDFHLRYGPKAEITHIFRAPEKQPPKELSLGFLGLTLLPFVGFLFGLLRLGVNLKNFPAATVPATFATLFQLGIAAVLGLYVLFWLKLNLFTTLKVLGFLGVFLVFTGHQILSHLASTSAKLKSS